jgi:hypothetical protein
MRHIFLALALLCFTFSSLQAQEFVCNVTINTPKIQTADPKVFKSLKTAITEFVNTRKWSEQELKPEERIELNIIITIDEEISATAFRAQMTVQAVRPVYGSNYNAVLFQHLDKDFVFSYGEFEVLDFSENAFTSNLTSIIAFYAYIALGFDGDSFSELGGEDHLQKAQNIANAVPANTFSGWKLTDKVAVDGRSRHFLISNLLNVRVQPMRRAFYQYYLLGLDRLSNNATRADGLKAMTQALEAIYKVNAEFPASMIMQVFSNMKRDEILAAFMVADVGTRRKVYDIMTKLDGTQAELYKDLLK